ncbi:DUF5666 domain-containing protein [Thalassotalea psychrophila]|uniref:DUF5666 domain-containing protein n=1 Tax=Thalassotalea psychrophila TaxID=3065647 RepID=A0ABY9TPJ5_9GAMM|nr:DUF5666 domain-containing protein [Colwelliaceae bacterium SQ149]
MLKFISFALAICLSTILITSCGGSSSSDPEVNLTDQQVKDINTLTDGEITGFGSVFVNGVKYDTSNAEISNDDGSPLNESDLALGMIVKIDGSINDDGLTGVAHHIFYSAEIKGLVEAINLDTRSLIVQGQTVLVNDLTHFDDTNFANLMVGDFVEVNGHFNDNGDLLATRIEKQNDSNDITIKGLIKELDTTNKQFMLGNLTIDYSMASFDNFNETDLANNKFVKVEGKLTNLINLTLQADEVKLITFKREDDDEEHSHHHLHGFISNLQDDNSFSIRDINIITNEQTRFRYGDKSSLANDVLVKIKGHYDDNNNLVASSIYFVQRIKVKVAGPVDAIDMTSQTITVLGIEFNYNEYTRFNDDTESDQHDFNIVDISASDYVKIKGFRNSSGDYFATKIIKKDENDSDDFDEPKFEGRVSNIVPYISFDIFSFTVTINDTTEYEIDDQHVTNEQFFNKLLDGMRVEVEGYFSNGGVVVTKVEIEEFEHQFEHHDQDRGMTGPVTNITDNNTFDVFGQTIYTKEHTRFENDVETDLAIASLTNDETLTQAEFFQLIIDGTMVEVEGGMHMGKFVAREVEIVDQDEELEVKGPYHHLTETSFDIFNISISYDENTVFENDSEESITSSAFFDLFPTLTNVEVEGSYENGSFTASEVEVDNDMDDDFEKDF